jgi:type IV pilus assembly protein PilM
MGLFSSNSNNYLGIDIGSSTLKMVELKKSGKKILLKNYGFTDPIENLDFSKLADVDYLAKVIVKLRSELGITTNRATVSLPSFSVFSSVINVPKNKKKLDEMVIQEAKKVLPLPIEEMVLDWKVIPGQKNLPESNEAAVFLTGSPKKLVKKYIDVFKKADIFLENLETETFSLIRSILGNDPSVVMMIQMGDSSTNFAIIKNDIPYLNRSINISGGAITKKISEELGIDLSQAEQFKLDFSLSSNEKNAKIPRLAIEAMDPIIKEIKYMLGLFQGGEEDKVEKIILSGGGSLSFNFSEHLEKATDIKTIVGDPFFRISYPEELRPILDEVGPRLGVAVGLALRGID